LTPPARIAPYSLPQKASNALEFRKKTEKGSWGEKLEEGGRKKVQLTRNLLEGNIKGAMLIDKILVKEDALENSGSTSRPQGSFNSELFVGIKQQKSRNRDFYWENKRILKEGSLKEKRKSIHTHRGVQ